MICPWAVFASIRKEKSWSVTGIAGSLVLIMRRRWNGINASRTLKLLKIFTGERVDDAVLTAILKYKVNYVVFMKYYGPPGDTPVLKKIYENEVFSLFQVI